MLHSIKIFAKIVVNVPLIHAAFTVYYYYYFIYYSDRYTFHFHKIACNTTIISIPSPLWAYKSLQIHINLMCMFTFNCSMMLQEKTFFCYSKCFQ